MGLHETLDRIREASRGRVLPEIRAVMERSIADLRASGIMQRIVQVGQPAPDFTLPNSAGTLVGLGDLRARGPVVLSFYRGRW